MLKGIKDWIVKTLSPDLVAFVQGMDIPDRDQGAKMTSPYQQSAWIYVAVSTMAENLAQIPFRISRVGSEKARRIRALRGSGDAGHREFCRRELGENVLESGEVVELFENPHPSMGQTFFWEQVVSWDCLRGEAFIVPLDDADEPVDLKDRHPRVSRLLTLTPEMFWHQVQGYELKGWRYTGSPLLSPLPSEMLLPSEVIHIRNVNPYLYWRGMSPLLVAMLPAMADYAAEMFMKGLLMNNADTGIIATTEQNLTQAQREQFTSALRERKRKAGTPDRPLFLSSGVKIEKPTISNVDMQFLETRRLLRQQIGAIYKVPESLMGFSESKASALSGGGNALNEEKLTFVEQNLGPKCHKYERALAPVIESFEPGLVGWFDIEGLSIMQGARRARVDTAVKVFGMGVPFNTLNKTYDLGFPEIDGGDQGWLPFSLQPAAGAGMEMPGEGMGEPNGEEDVEDEEDDQQEPKDQEETEPIAAALRFLGNGLLTSSPTRKVLWEHHMRARAGTVKLIRGKVNRALMDARGRALSALASGDVSAAETAAVRQKGLIDLVFNKARFGAELRVLLTPVMNQALETAGAQLMEEIGFKDPWKFPPEKAVSYAAGREQAVMGCAETVRSQLNTALTEGFEAGEGIEELSDRVRGVFNNLSKYEATRIAQTETGMAFNFARHEGMKEAGVEYKGWLSSHGPSVRPAHAAAEAKYMNEPIPVDEPFVVGGEELMYPGDDAGSAGNIINCQCVQIAVAAPRKG